MFQHLDFHPAEIDSVELSSNRQQHVQNSKRNPSEILLEFQGNVLLPSNQKDPANML